MMTPSGKNHDRLQFTLETTSRLQGKSYKRSNNSWSEMYLIRRAARSCPSKGGWVLECPDSSTPADIVTSWIPLIPKHVHSVEGLTQSGHWGAQNARILYRRAGKHVAAAVYYWRLRVQAAGRRRSWRIIVSFAMPSWLSFVEIRNAKPNRGLAGRNV